MARRIRKRDEDLADKWLREHDPYYTNRSRNKTNRAEGYYLTPDQEYARYRKEIPFSSLSEADQRACEIKSSL